MSEVRPDHSLHAERGIRTAEPRDAPGLCEVYNPYVCDSIITFEETPISVDEMRARVSRIGSSHPWLVYEEADRLVGYAYANAWRPRAAYRYALETTIYLHPGCVRRGHGSALYRALIQRSREAGFKTLIGGIALPNAASVALHESLGFRKVAHFECVGFKFDRWIDVGYWQLVL